MIPSKEIYSIIMYTIGSIALGSSGDA